MTEEPAIEPGATVSSGRRSRVLDGTLWCVGAGGSPARRWSDGSSGDARGRRTG
jgi:hypothetical protein